MTTRSNDPESALQPGVEGAEAVEQQSSGSNPRGSVEESGEERGANSQLPERVEWLLPDDSDTDGDGRTGFLSTRKEVHAFVMGIAAWMHFELEGDAQLINDVIGLGMAGDRSRRAPKDDRKYREQAKDELPYFIGGIIVAVVGVRATKAGLLPV